MGVIYKISLGENIYIGSTTRRFSTRRREHIKMLREKIHHSRYLQNAFNKYGEQSIAFSVVEKVKKNDDILKREQYYIDLLNPKYNMRKTVIGRSAYSMYFGTEDYKIIEVWNHEINQPRGVKRPFLSLTKYIPLQDEFIKRLPQCVREKYLEIESSDYYLDGPDDEDPYYDKEIADIVRRTYVEIMRENGSKVVSTKDNRYKKGGSRYED